MQSGRSEVQRPMIFGVYAGSVAGDDQGELASGPEDDVAAIRAALDTLQGVRTRPFLVRSYLAFNDAIDPLDHHETLTPVGAARLAAHGRRLDLVAQYQSRGGDVAGYGLFVRSLVEQYGSVIGTLQITEEPNVSGLATLDGDYPRVAEAIVEGVTVARSEATRLGHDHVKIGFNTTPLFGPAQTFVHDVVQCGGERFVNDLDYVGLDFFPDVFAPIEPAKLADAVSWLLAHHRTDVLDPAGLLGTDIHITEHGWPTAPGRSHDRQDRVVETVVRAAHRASSDLSVAAYVHFALRDADSSNDGLFHHFGLMSDTYEPKPAFETLRRLIDELSE